MNDIFKKSIKTRQIEELIDYYLFRRMASWMIRPLAVLKLTPNQVSWIGLLFGFLSAWIFFKGYFLQAAFILWFAVVLDCCDGMLARYTGQSSPIGRVVDGLCDALWVTAIWCGIYFSRKLYLGNNTFLLIFMSVSGFFMYLHCWTFDKTKNEYLELCYPQWQEGMMSAPQAWEEMKKNFKNGHWGIGIVYLAMAFHANYFNAEKSDKKETLTDSIRQKRQKFLDAPMRLWTFTGEGTHLFLMILGGLLTPFYSQAMLVVFWIILIGINLIWVIAFFWWKVSRRKVY